MLRVKLGRGPSKTSSFLQTGTIFSGPLAMAMVTAIRSQASRDMQVSNPLIHKFSRAYNTVKTANFACYRTRTFYTRSNCWSCKPVSYYLLGLNNATAICLMSVLTCEFPLDRHWDRWPCTDWGFLFQNVHRIHFPLYVKFIHLNVHRVPVHDGLTVVVICLFHRSYRLNPDSDFANVINKI